MTAHGTQTTHTAPAGLAEEVARVVSAVPGVAFLKPGLAARLRSPWSCPAPGRPSTAGVRLTPFPGPGPEGEGGGWQVDVQVVALRRARTVEVARAARAAVQGHLAEVLPGRPPARVTVTVTGLV
ncbi:hypothetical protein NX794_32260 [Streptomyces sp. LP11]|uniref:Asp23/Gls24 family envelope stress response protein n=1 Tax=Streptomyces pyxinicus TaxID=2970331 RepID=A0ABT2BBE5_9ACTN|nr:hypothetical protein [Streptomyces sp. LP11]MCS0605844.1 hypothetical protein [Streptomyces sp. LP11]